MPKPVINFKTRISSIPSHSIDMPQEAEFPRLHYERSASDAWNSVLYFERNLARVNVYQASSERHLRRLNSMVLLSLVETFERFLKELASVCIDHVGLLVLDDRLSKFSMKGSSFATHFNESSLGRALCESMTWVSCVQANDRFRSILADPFHKGDFQVFTPNSLRYNLMEIVWQLRHSIVHNAGVVTRSDALKFQLLTKGPVENPRILWPSRGEVWYVKLYLDKIVEEINEEVGLRLEALMTTLWADDPSLFDPAEKAQILANLFRRPTAISGIQRSPS